jgi:signal transduction histidine kinase
LGEHRRQPRGPALFASVRFRLAATYSAVVFGLAALMVAGVYAGLSRALAKEDITEERIQFRGRCIELDIGLYCPEGITAEQVEVVNEFRAVEKAAKQEALERFRQYAFPALAGLFLVSVGVGWLLADLTLRPIGRITRVARRISATDLSQRIGLGGPDDELRELADTFDDMLARVEAGFENQRQFIQEASHELRNPIAVIRTNVDVALSDPRTPPEELRETLAVVGRASERMGVLVDDLLLYARRGASAERMADIDLGQLVDETAADFTVTGAARKITLARQTEPGLMVMGDPVALRQALANLTANAVRLAPEGSTVTLAAGRRDQWVWMACADEGPGITAGDQARVFDRFWQGDRVRGRAQGRSGLGLAIVRQIAQAHGGAVGLRSAPGLGSVFSVWLPIKGSRRTPERAGPAGEG